MQINPLLLHDTISIFREGDIKTDTGWTNGCTLLFSDVPASLGCGEGNMQILSCLPKKRTTRDICAEISPDIELACFDKDIIIEVIRGGCNIGKYRIFDIIPNKLIATGGLYSYHLIGTQING